MKKAFKFIIISIVILVVAALSYGGLGYIDAINNTDQLKQRADSLIAQGLGGRSLGEDRYQQLLTVQDPQFEQHSGLDMTTPGAGITTISQSLAKRVGFEKFRPGIGKIRQTGYALGLEKGLSKEQIIALWLDTLEMGKGPDGWMTGFHKASETIFGRKPHEIENKQFLSLIAVMIAPGRYKLGTDDTELNERVDRISKLVAGLCTPESNSDVWLEGCR